MSFITGAEPLRRFLAKVNSRSRLTPDERDAVLALPCVPRQVQANREIVRLGEQVEHSCLVVDGYVARFALLEDGSRQIVSLHIAGDMVDLYSLMLPAVPTPLVALSLSTIVQIPHSALRTLTFQHPAVAAALWRECVVDGAIVAQWLVNVGRREARGRIGHLFCELAIRSNQIGRLQAGRFPLAVTQEQLADALGLTPVHVNRTLQTLRKEGLLEVSQREVTILDWGGLASISGFDAEYLQLGNLPGTAERSAVQ
jgi:CRP-like cAMP-binding protein